MQDAVVDPAVELGDPGSRQFAGVGPQHIGPLEGPEGGVVGVLDEAVDELGALVGGGVVQECLSLFNGRQSPARIERGPADELFIGAEVGGENQQLLELLVDLHIDEVQLGRIVPGEVRHIVEERQERGRHLVEVAGENGGLTATVLLDDPFVADLGHALRGGTEHGQGGHIADGAIAVRAQHDDLLPSARRLEHPLVREDLDRLQIRLVRRVES